MGITIRDALGLDALKDFSVVAGEGGLDREFETVEIMDYEFTPGIVVEREDIISANSFVISTLLFALNKPQLLIETVEKLIAIGACGMAYKRIVFDEMPDEVIAMANRHSFPIVVFGGDEFFEDVIYDIRTRLNQETDIERDESLVTQMMDEHLDTKEIKARAFTLCADFTGDIIVYNVLIMAENPGEEAVRAVKNYRRGSSKRRRRTAVNYKDTIMVIISTSDSTNNAGSVFNDALWQMGLREEQVVYGVSRVCPAAQMNRALQEACHARIIAEVDGLSHQRYENAGIYKMILKKDVYSTFVEYMRDYLQPIIADKEGSSSELLPTAIAYIQTRGDIDQTALRLFCHKNTIRYRIKKIQEKLLGSEMEDAGFFEELNIAIKTYLIYSYYSQKNEPG